MDILVSLFSYVTYFDTLFNATSNYVERLMTSLIGQFVYILATKRFHNPQ